MLVAILDDTIHTDTPHGRAIKRIVTGLEEYGITVAGIASPADAKAAYANMPEVDCFLINWNLGGDTAERHSETAGIIHEIRKRNEDIPIFLMGEPTTAPPTSLTIDMIKEINEYIWVRIPRSSLQAASRLQRNVTGNGCSPRFLRSLSGFQRISNTHGTPRAMPGGLLSGSRRPAGPSSSSSGNSSSAPISPSRSGSSARSLTIPGRSGKPNAMQPGCSGPMRPIL